MKNYMQSIALGAAIFAATGAATGSVGCGSDDDGPLGNVDSLVILQRAEAQRYGRHLPVHVLHPGREAGEALAADRGRHARRCCAATRPARSSRNIDISGYDISFDAKEIVFSGKLAGSDALRPVPADARRRQRRRRFRPTRVATTCRRSICRATRSCSRRTPSSRPGARQHRDEYERGTTHPDRHDQPSMARRAARPAQPVAPHRPSLASDGRVIFTQWDHLGAENAGHLMFMNRT